jgi:two-component system chemotaxis sensor kinase CheA
MTDREVLNLIFSPGVSTSAEVTEISGRGVGLDVVRDSVARLGGRIEFFTDAGKGAQFKLCLPLTLAASRGLLVSAGKEVYCVPLTAVDEVVSIEPSQVGMAQGQLVLEWRRQAVSFIQLQDLLTSRPAVRPETKLFAIVIAISDRRLALGVEELMGQEEVVVKGLAPGTPHLPFVAGATSLADGRLVTVLEPSALVDAAAKSSAVGRMSRQSERPATVLVADDSLTTRMMISSVLDRAGYRTLLAQDGANAYRILMQEKVDLVVSDVEMPVLDGFSLVRQIRGSPSLASLPVILVTSLGSGEDRARGAEAGADGYVVKKDFDPGAFLSMVVDFLERPETK